MTDPVTGPCNFFVEVKNNGGYGGFGDDAGMIGRPFIAAVGGLKDDVSRYIARLHGELKAAMVLTGVARADAVDRGILSV